MRDFELDEEKQASVEEATTKLREDAEDKKKHLEMWSMTAYGEVGCSCCRMRPALSQL